ncbi:MAG: DUF4384 domain-containing protein [Cytophagaceae bacterium]|nr:DUF4384 domain-containing protein [Cytophagaceae bacterium]
MRYVLILLLLGFLSPMTPAFAQAYTKGEKVRIANSARRLVEEKYFANLEILTHYEANQPVEALQNHINGMLRDAFLSREVLIFNEFKNTADPYTTLAGYVKDCRIFAAGKPVVNTLNVKDARYDIQRTKDGMPFINVYLEKQLRGTDKQGKPFRFQHLTEFRIRFVFDKQLNTYHQFRIAGISKAEKWPATAFTFTANEVEQAENEPKDLQAVLSALTDQIKTALPANTKQLVLETFTYNRCEINDGLSDRIFATLGSCLQKQTQIQVIAPAQRTGAGLTVRGYYREDLNNLRLVADIYDPQHNQVLKTIENADLPLTWISQQNLKLKPEQYQQVAAVRDTLQRNKMTAPATLSVEVRTDRGRKSVEYWEGNQLLIDVKASLPCHVRLVNLRADGTKILLENDFEIKPGQENQYVRVAPGVSFICSEPFGTEHLLMYASANAFCPLPTKPNTKFYVRNESGDAVLVGSLPELIAAVTCTKNQSLVAEDRIQITTRGILKGN